MFGISLAYSYLCTRYGTANRNNPEAETSRFPFGDERDTEPVAEIAEDGHREHLQEAHQLRTEYQRVL